jgi:signal transduction histidine kinase
LNETRRLDRIVNQIIDYARPRDVLPSTWTVGDVIEEVLKLLDTRIVAQRIAVVRPPSAALVVQADRDQIKQVLLNLCQNALDAMPEGGELKLTATATRQGDIPGVSMDVADNGSGIDPKDLPHVFQPFFTVRKRQGTGLGLAICRNIVEAHGGDISLTSEPGRGTTAKLWLPQEPSPGGARPIV